MIRAISPPKVQFNPNTNKWEAPGRPDLIATQVKKTIAPCNPVFSGEHEPLAAPWWGDLGASTPKCWKHQSVRQRQYRPK